MMKNDVKYVAAGSESEYNAPGMFDVYESTYRVQGVLLDVTLSSCQEREVQRGINRGVSLPHFIAERASFHSHSVIGQSGRPLIRHPL